MKKFHKILFALITLSFLSFTNDAPNGANEYKFHSIFIYNFTRYIQWPAEYRSGDFVITVIGESDITPYLHEMAKKKQIRNQSFQIVSVDKLTDIPQSHIIYVPTEQSDKVGQLVDREDTSSTLIITEKSGMCQKGSGINFILVNGKWKFELNKAALEEAQLKISSELVRFAIMV